MCPRARKLIALYRITKNSLSFHGFRITNGEESKNYLKDVANGTLGQYMDKIP